MAVIRTERGLDRLVNFSDATVAIAITLLILPLVDQASKLGGKSFGDFLAENGWEIFAFVISFENLELALFLTSPGVTTLPVAVLQYLEYHIDPLVSAVAVAQIVAVAAVLLLLDRFVRLGKVVQ